VEDFIVFPAFKVVNSQKKNCQGFVVRNPQTTIIEKPQWSIYREKNKDKYSFCRDKDLQGNVV